MVWRPDKNLLETESAKSTESLSETTLNSLSIFYYFIYKLSINIFLYIANSSTESKQNFEVASNTQHSHIICKILN